MQVRNILIAAGAVLASVSALAAAPTVASAQGYQDFGRPYERAYVQPYRAYQPGFAYAEAPDGSAHRGYWENRHQEDYRHARWEHRGFYEGYRSW